MTPSSNGQGRIEMKGLRVALIGGAGFIGHHLALGLTRLGAKVTVVDNLMVNNLLTYAGKMPDLIGRDMYLRILHERLELLHAAGVDVHVLDARDYHALGHLLSEQVQPNVIVHLAAVAHAGKSNKDPYSTFDHSLRTLENALDLTRSRLEHFVFFSSSMVYGNFKADEVPEDHPLEPMGIYGALKVAAEKIVIAYNQVFGIPYTIVRPSALYGPRCVSRRVGQIFIESALRGGVLRMDGDGTDRLDFTYIDDLVDGIAKVIESPASRNDIFNLTCGQGRSIQELVEIVRGHFPDIRVERVERDALMPQRGTLSIRKAREKLGYDPQWPLERGFDEYIRWYRSLNEQVGVRPVPHANR